MGRRATATNGVVVVNDVAKDNGCNGDSVVVEPRSPSPGFSPDCSAEYFFASDPSAVVEHTRKVIFLEVSKATL